jgi:hypothetical protein
VAITGCCFERYFLTSAALAEKRLQQQCKPMREMIKKIMRKKGRHLVALVGPHFCSCESCQKWARSRGYDLAQIPGFPKLEAS